MNILIEPAKMREGLHRAKESFIYVVLSGLVLAFVNTLTSYVTDKLRNANIFGVDPPVFLLLALGGCILVFAFFGIYKKP